MYYFTVNYSTIYYCTTTPAVCISETDLRRFTQDFTILLFYYYSTTAPAVCISETDLRQFTQDFTILLFQYCTILLCTILLLTIPLFTILPRPQPFASRKPTCAGSPRILLFYYYSTTAPAVCISETDLRRFTQDFTILLVQYCTILLCTILLLTIPLFTILPRPQPFASRKPTCAGSPRILLFYYFTTLLPRPQPFASRKPTCAGSRRILLFYYYTTTTPAVCISETDLRRFTQDFTILLFQYCTILLCTILLLTIPLFTILPRPQPFASRKPTCAGASPRTLLFYYFHYFTISVLYYSTMYYFTVNYSTIYYSTTTPAVCISETDLRRFTQDFTILLLFYHGPSRLHLGNRPAPVHPGFYYFTSSVLVLFYYVLFYC